MADYLAEHWILSIIITIFLGALGSGLWDTVFKPFSARLGKAVFTVLSFNARRARDKIYKNAAMGHHGLASIELLLIAMAGIIALTIFSHVKAYGVMYGPSVIETFASECLDKQVNDVAACTKVVLKEKIFPFLQVATLFSVFASVILTYRFIAINRSNLVTTYFQQSMKVIRPFIDEKILFDLEKRFAQVETKGDYESVIDDIKLIATNHDTELPKSYIQ